MDFSKVADKLMVSFKGTRVVAALPLAFESWGGTGLGVCARQWLDINLVGVLELTEIVAYSVITFVSFFRVRGLGSGRLLACMIVG